MLDRIRALLGSSFGAEAGGDAASKAENIIRGAGGTSEGMLKLLREMAPLYDRAAEILQLPAGEYDKAMAEFDVSMKTNVNPLVQEFFPSFDKARKKEFATQIIVAMVRAGIEHKLRGADGLASVPDPCTGVPFDLDHFVFEGVDRVGNSIPEVVRRREIRTFDPYGLRLWNKPLDKNGLSGLCGTGYGERLAVLAEVVPYFILKMPIITRVIRDGGRAAGDENFRGLVCRRRVDHLRTL